MNRNHSNSKTYSRLPLKLAALLLLGLAACATPDTTQPAAGLQPQYLQIPTPVESPVLEPTVGKRALEPKTSKLTTRWASQVSTEQPLPEYPRPQLTRQTWLNLNGQWQFQGASAGEAPPVGQTLDETILVPFPVESALSGIQRFDDRMWYRRVFELPEGWDGQRIQLNFGAVDYEAKVWVNGQEIGQHKGGYDAFNFDITGALQEGENELLVSVFDPTDAGAQPVGKQSNNPGGIWYTSVSGIWQTVWLEPVAEGHITRLDLTPNLGSSTLDVRVLGENLEGQTVNVTALDGDRVVGSVSGSAAETLSVSVPNPRLWSPDDPFLYDLVATVGDDTVGSYFGMRSIEVGEVNGVPRPLLNGEFVFQLGTLDQGYWPDGLYTAPTDDALKFDLEAHKDFGFNMVRKHIKVEPQRWFYWADKLGLMVWQDMPSMTPPTKPNAAEKAVFETELRAMIDQHRSAPSIVTWVSLNEGWGQFDQARLADLIKDYDPTRLVNNMSGINCCGAVDGGNGDIADVHFYVDPSAPSAAVADGRLRMLGEYGGLGLRVEGHLFDENTVCCYELTPNREVLNTRYLGMVKALKSLMINRGLSASVYTEISDVESEINGLFTYDREINKMDTEALKAAHEDLLASAGQEPVEVNLPVGEFRSFQVTTNNFTDRYMRHRESLGYTEVVTKNSPDLLKSDATFKIVPGLAETECYSLESKSVPGEFLRHRQSRVYTEPTDGSDTFDRDATWCARPGLLDGQVSLESFNFPERYLRHFNAELWLAQNGGPLETDASLSFNADISWNIVAPWSP